MMLDATVAGPTANSYVTLAEATTLLTMRLHTEPWTSASTADQATALMWATSLLDRQVRWDGVPTTTTQALDWPRTGTRDCALRPIDAMTIPLDIQKATASQALALLRDQSESPAVTSGTGVKRRQIGRTTVEYFQPQEGAVVARGPQVVLPAEIRAMLGCYGRVAGSVVVPLLRT